MPRILHSLLFTLLGVTVLPSMAAAAVIGVVVKDAGTVVASAVDTTVLGEIAVEPFTVSPELEVFFVDDVLGEIQPAAPSFTWSAAVADSAVASFQSGAAFTFTVAAHDPGSTTLQFTLLENGAPVFVSSPIPLHSEEAHIEADGFVLRQGTETLLHVWRGVVTGQLSVAEGAVRGPIDVFFLAPDSTEFQPVEPDFVMRLEIADTSVVTWRPLASWSFELHGEAAGTTGFTLNVFHVDHDDFISPPLNAQAQSTLSVGPGLSTLSMSAPTPNPTRERGTLRFTLGSTQRAELSVFDIAGREVRRLADGIYAAGTHVLELDARDLEVGVYLVRLRTASGAVTRRLNLAR
jgi:Secretion system C-terminal sorting domain